jgi:DNA (cytosine-5)-methyltransferase 1
MQDTRPVLGYTTALANLRQHAGPARVRSWTPWDGYERRGALWVPGEAASGPPPGHPPIAVDLFAGAGGFSLGLHQAGFHVVAALEKWPTAVHTYLANLGSPRTRIVCIDEEDRQAWAKEMRTRPGDSVWPGGPGWTTDAGDLGGTSEYARHWQDEQTIPGGAEGLPESECEVPFHPCAAIILGDVRRVTGEDILACISFATGWPMRPGDLDLVVGGPPCQGFSTAGKRQVMDPRNSLVFEFVRLVCELQPKTMAMENVPGMLSMVTEDGEPVVDALCRVLESGGMGCRDQLRQMIETTAGVGVAQRSVRRAGEEPPKGETRADRRRRLREERKEAKRAAARAGSIAEQGDLFAGVGQ